MSQKYFFIVNRCGGKGRTIHIWKQLEALLKKKNISYEVFFTEYESHAEVLAAELTSKNKEIKLIIVGGDGTINGVLNGIKDFNTAKIGIIPSGSGNDIARELKIPIHNRKKALSLILNSQGNFITDAGQIEITKTENDAQKTFTRIFAISAGIGLDAIACLKNVSSKIKFFFNKIHLGSLSYIANAVQYFTHLPEQAFSIQFEDTDSNSAESKNQISISKTILISLMNYKAEGGGLKMAPWANHSDGKISLVAAYDIPFYKIPAKLTTLLLGRHNKAKNFYTKDTSFVTISSTKNFILHTDGECFTEVSKVTCKVLPQIIHFLR